MNRLPYLSSHLRTLNPQREKRRFLRLYLLALAILAFDYWYIRNAEQAFRRHDSPEMRETPNYGIQREWQTTTDAGIEVKPVRNSISFTF